MEEPMKEMPKPDPVAVQLRKDRFDYLDERIPQLRKEGMPGRDARLQADSEFSRKMREAGRMNHPGPPDG
jgi:hypothetical protein